jgi:two-component system, NtrC family, sensor kinase
MMRGGVAIGAVAFTRPEPGGYTDDEIALLETFADQAAIAVDNARLLREIEERNAELSESLELQTATSEILQLISANPGNLDAVFDGIIEQSIQLCDADGGSVLVRDGIQLEMRRTGGLKPWRGRTSLRRHRRRSLRSALHRRHPHPERDHRCADRRRQRSSPT